MSASAPGLAAWHAAVARGDAAALHALLAEDACFHSPVLHRPQQGRELTALYLGAAFHVTSTELLDLGEGMARVIFAGGAAPAGLDDPSRQA